MSAMDGAQRRDDIVQIQRRMDEKEKIYEEMRLAKRAEERAKEAEIETYRKGKTLENSKRAMRIIADILDGQYDDNRLILPTFELTLSEDEDKRFVIETHDKETTASPRRKYILGRFAGPVGEMTEKIGYKFPHKAEEIVNVISHMKLYSYDYDRYEYMYKALQISTKTISEIVPSESKVPKESALRRIVNWLDEYI